MWRIRKDGKFKRMLAAWVGICMVLQIVIGSLAPLGTYAEEEPLKKTITVKESKIIDVLEGAGGSLDPDDSPDVKDEWLPYKNKEQKQAAADQITPYLMGTRIVTTKKLGDNCTAIVAASRTDDEKSEKGFSVENVVFIGLNGNADRDCEFTLQITDANGIVIRSMTIITYALKGTAATSSEATGSEATGSEASNSEIVTTLEADSKATPGEATDSEIATDSEAGEGGYRYEEADRKELGEEELDGLLVRASEAGTPGSVKPATPDETEENDGPSMRIKAGGFGVAYAESSMNAGGKVAQITVSVNQGGDEVPSGETATFHIAADYSRIDEKLPDYAFFTVQFQVKDHKGNSYDHITGPEKADNVIPVSSLADVRKTEWEKIITLMKASEDYKDMVSYDDWIMVPVAGEDRFYYSPSASMAVFGVNDGGSTVSDMPVFFTFDNYITPHGSSITAIPGILNREELKKGYESSSGPAHSGDSVLITGDPQTITSTAKFHWNPVGINGSGSLGNIAVGTGKDGEIRYDITVSKNYGPETGRLYTKEYTIIDVITFDGFYFDMTGYGISERTGLQKTGELFLTKDGDEVTEVTKLLGLGVPGGSKTGMADPIYDPSNPNRLIGFEVRYRVVNDTLSSDAPDITKGSLSYYLGLNNVINRAPGVIVYDQNRGDGWKPSVTNKVYFDAYSIMYEGDTDFKIDDRANDEDGLTYHHSIKDLNLNATGDYTLTKGAFTSAACDTEATGINKIFEPGDTVYYKITAQNGNYKDEPFKIKDLLPAALDITTLSTDSVKVNRKGTGKADKLELGSGYDLETIPGEGKAESTAVWKDIELAPGDKVEIIFHATVKSKDILKKDEIDTTLNNKAELHRNAAPAGATPLKSATATVYVNLNTLDSSKVSFSKEAKTSNQEGSDYPAVGSNVEYTLATSLSENVKNSHWVTMVDNSWPEQVTLNKITNLPPDSILTLYKKTDGMLLKRYSNTSNKDKDYPLSAEEASQVGKIEVQVYLTSKNKSEEVVLKGVIKTEGTITNSGHAEGGDSGGDDDWNTDDTETKFSAIGASLEKKAYFIPSDEKGNITESNSTSHPVDQNVTFRTGNIVCYEIKFANTGKGKIEGAAVSDSFGDLFGSSIRAKDYLTDAKLDGKTASMFYRLDSKDTAGEWEKLEYENGGINEKNITLEPGETALFRIYLEIPDKASQKQPVNTAFAQIKINENGDQAQLKAAASITINEDTQKASIDKEVYAVAGGLEIKNKKLYLKKARWNNSSLGTDSDGYVKDDLTVGKGDYVFYKITLNNESVDQPLRIYETEDWLPKGMKVVRFYTFNGADRVQNIPGAVSGTDTLCLGAEGRAPAINSNNNNWVFYDDATSGTWNNNAAAKIHHGTAYTSVENTDDGQVYRARLYVENMDPEKVPVIAPGRSLVYGLIVQVTKDFPAGTVLENTAGLIVDSTAEIPDGTEREVPKGEVGKKSYSEALYQVTTATAEVKTTGVYAPGIEKKLAQYQLNGTWKNYMDGGVNENFLPTQWMRWQVSLENGTNDFTTRGPIENYTLRDTLPVDLTYNEKDGNYIQNANGTIIWLPAPKMESREGERIVISWTVQKEEDGSYTITGADGAVEKNIEDLSIPIDGTLKVQIGTRAEKDTAKYGTYVNEAELIPIPTKDNQYEFTEACAGTIIKDSEGKGKAVHAEATVDIFFGAGKTEAWKQITGSLNGKESTVSGRNSDDNVITADESSEIMYTLNMTSQINKDKNNGMENLVLVDRLPALNDNGLVNNMKRNSDFAVKFAKSVDVSVSLNKKAGGTVRLDSGKDYDVSYLDWSSKIGNGSALPAEYWTPGGDTNWSDSADGNDTIRIELSSERAQEIESGDTVVVTFKAQLPSAAELKVVDNMIAWNTFGYAYNTKSQAQTITVEPAKVGVQIPTATLSVTKQVKSNIAEDLTADTKFTFKLEENSTGNEKDWKPVADAVYKLSSGSGETAASGVTDEFGQFKLSHKETAKFVVPVGRSYRVLELDADGYYVTVAGFGGSSDDQNGGQNSVLFNPEVPPATILDKAENGGRYYCTFTNSRTSFFLPETGGVGTDGFRHAGTTAMLLAVVMMAGYGFDILLKKRRKEESCKKQ